GAGLESGRAISLVAGLPGVFDGFDSSLQPDAKPMLDLGDCGAQVGEPQVVVVHSGVPGDRDLCERGPEVRILSGPAIGLAPANVVQMSQFSDDAAADGAGAVVDAFPR